MDMDPRTWPVEKPPDQYYDWAVMAIAMVNAQEWLEEAAKGQTPTPGFSLERMQDDKRTI